MKVNAVTQDLRFGARMLRKSPVVSAIAILTFALGVGVNVAIFSVADAIALRPLDVPDPGRIVRISIRIRHIRSEAAPRRGFELQALPTETKAFVGITAADRRAIRVGWG